jgi:uncharacterized protein (TIGR03083 family)
MNSSELLLAARDGLTTTVEAYARLIENQADTSTPIPGAEWTVRDAAVHLAGANYRYAALTRGEPSTVEAVDRDQLAARARRLIAENPETDGKKLADQIRDGFDVLIDQTAGAPAERTVVYHGGLKPSVAELTALLLGEYLLHGYDVATAAGVAWPIDPARAAVAVRGYRIGYGAIFDAAAGRGFEATYLLQGAGTNPLFVRIADGAYEEPTALAGVDCIIAADAVTELLVISGRLTQWQAIALGRLTFTGDRPEIGPRFADLFVFP